jgi:hypothetical protein
MIVTPVEVALTLPPPVGRSAGVHVSSIIRCIATETGVLDPRWTEELSLSDVREITNPEAVLKIHIGLAWEEHYIPLLTDVADHPGEMCVDGIYMTHDGESLSVMVTPPNQCYWSGSLVEVVHEVKATYKSIRTVGDLSTQWMWLGQMKAYCKGKGTRFAELHCLFLCGDYSYPIRPRLLRWRIEFEQREIDDNWDLLREYKEQFKRRQDGISTTGGL